MKRNIKLKGQLRVYMQWPLIMLALLVGMNIWIYTVDGNAGLILSTFIAIYGIAVGCPSMYILWLVVQSQGAPVGGGGLAG